MPLLAIGFLVMVAGYVIQAVAMKKPKGPSAATLDSFEIPQVDEGTPQAVVFGEGWLDGWQVVWHGNYRTTKITSGGGGKK
jgi:hypothetical protein